MADPRQEMPLAIRRYQSQPRARRAASRLLRHSSRKIT